MTYNILDHESRESQAILAQTLKFFVVFAPPCASPENHLVNSWRRCGEGRGRGSLSSVVNLLFRARLRWRSHN